MYVSSCCFHYRSTFIGYLDMLVSHFFSGFAWCPGNAWKQRRGWTTSKKIKHKLIPVFSSEGVGVVIRSAECYDLVKIKPAES